VAIASQEAALVAAVRDGDEDAFARLLGAYGGAMRRCALALVRDPAAADQVVQESWLLVLDGLGFEGRGSLRTWTLRIVATRAIARMSGGLPGERLPNFAEEAAGDERAVDPERFRNPRYPGGWTAFPEPWGHPDAGEARSVVARAIEQLPTGQRLVITLRDVEGCSADEVCTVLELSADEQRVLLHRARSKVRAALERHLTAT
jgi:RNA polymerase sigma-70 factor (ECF subfamily)